MKSSDRNRVKCPVNEPIRQWIEDSFAWMLEQYSFDVLQHKQVLTPHYNDFPIKFKGQLSDAENALNIVTKQMNVEANKVQLHTYQEGLGEVSANDPLSRRIFMGQFEDEKYSSGLYYGNDKSGIYHIGLEKKTLDDPEKIIGILAHELSHVKLLGEGRITQNNEHLTDLTVIFYGLGIFNANLSFRHKSNFNSYSISKTGYLSQMEWGYALALYAHLRREEMPDWTKYLSPNILADFRLGRSFIHQNGHTVLLAREFSAPPEHPDFRNKKTKPVDSSSNDDTLSLTYKNAIELFRANNYAEAGPIFYGIVIKTPLYKNAFRYGIFALAKCKDNNKAAELIEQFSKYGIMEEPDMIKAGLVFANLENYSKAQDFYQKAIDLNPFCSTAMNNIGFALNKQEKYNEAIPYFDEAIECDPQFAYAYNNRGLAKVKTGKPEEGLKDIQHSIELIPENAYSFRNLGIYYLERNENNKALVYFEKAKELDYHTDDIEDFIILAKKQHE